MGKVKSLLDMDDVVDRLSRDMAADMDFSIMADMLEQQGWYHVELPYFESRHHAVDVVNWVEDHCQGRRYNHSREYIFEKLEDASLFALRWL